MRFLAGFITAFVVLIVGGLIVMVAGLYDVAASRPHNPLVRWAFHTTMENAVGRHAVGIAAPLSFTEAQVQGGVTKFAQTCAQCHGGPGSEAANWAKGMRPQPPELGHAVGHYTTAELFWIVRNGIRMTGMPAIGDHHSDEEIWEIIAFVETLPNLTPEKYREMLTAAGAEPPAPGGGAGGEGHAH